MWYFTLSKSVYLVKNICIWGVPNEFRLAIRKFQIYMNIFQPFQRFLDTTCVFLVFESFWKSRYVNSVTKTISFGCVVCWGEKISNNWTRYTTNIWSHTICFFSSLPRASGWTANKLLKSLPRTNRRTFCSTYCYI